MLNPTYALLKILTPPDETLDRWNRLLADRNVPMLAGADAHGFPSYDSLFRLAQNHLLLEHPLSGDAKADSIAIVSSLERGRGYVGLDALAPTSGFFFEAEQGDRRWTMGDAVPLTPAPHLRAGGTLPTGASLSLIHNGHVVAEGTGSVDVPGATAGVYRVEVRLQRWEIPWIVSNPIYVFDASTHEARRRRALLPPAPASVSATRVLDDFDAGTVFEAASDRSTVLARDIIDPHGSADGSAAAHVRFRLGVPAADTPSPFAALVSLQHRDLSGSQGLVFSIKGDNVYRVWVQVRDVNPEAEDGTEWWYASVKASTEWRRVAIPFGRFRTRDAHTDGHLDLENTKGVLFIVDAGVAKPGTNGVIWVDDVSVY
jgi:hypothetical protein